MKKATVKVLDFIIMFVILVLIAVGVVGLFPFYVIRKGLTGEDTPKLKVTMKGEEGEESFSPSTDKPM
jgi:flagellar basal body-associated protein FliL